MQNRRSHQQDFHITTSTILASTLHITRLNTKNQGVTITYSNSGAGFRPGFDPSVPQNSAGVTEPPGRPENNQDSVANPVQIPGQADIRQAEGGPNPGLYCSIFHDKYVIYLGLYRNSFVYCFKLFVDYIVPGGGFLKPCVCWFSGASLLCCSEGIVTERSALWFLCNIIAGDCGW
ncbi:hypothetical protein HN51_065951 [Arachis hypogaea]